MTIKEIISQALVDKRLLIGSDEVLVKSVATAEVTGFLHFEVEKLRAGELPEPWNFYLLPDEAFEILEPESEVVT